MKTLWLILALAGGLLFQSTWLARLTLWGAKPDLLLLAVVFTALLKGAREAAGVGFAFGLVEDLLLGRHLGLNILAKSFTGYLVGLSRDKIFRKNPLVLAAANFTGSVICQLIYLSLARLAGGKLFFTWRLLFGEAFYNLIVALLFYGLYRRLLEEIEGD